VNFASRGEVRRCGWYRSSSLQRTFPWAFRFTTPRLDNAVAVFAQRPSDPAVLREHVLAQPLLARALRDRRLVYRVQALDAADPRRRGKRDGRRRRA
jgi:hypothetical protein